jgi:predicted aspartyl protease
MMGRFSVDVELANNEDLMLARLGHISADQVRRVKIRGVVDTGATRLVIPASVAKLE